MNYFDALSYINDKNKFGSRLGLDSISKLLELLGNPHKELTFIHIAGTNGKGSTSSYIANCLLEAGYQVGLFTSPYLERFNERIKLNGQDIPDEDLARITLKIKEAADKMVSQGWEHPVTFEIVTVLAFLYFKEKAPDYIVLEVGLGGRFDSTNIIEESLASIITTIDFDHIRELGNSLEEIAYQKAGIIKDKGLVISYPQKDQVKKVIEEVAEERKAELYTSPYVEVKMESDRGSIFDYSFQDINFKNIEISMIGRYQAYNAALAITSLLVLREKGKINIKDEEIYKGLLTTRWNGRLEVLRREPIFLIDGAHNLQGIRNLVKSLELFSYDRLILGIGILKDKEVDEMVRELVSLADEIVVTEVNMPRKIPAQELAEKISKINNRLHIAEDIKEAVEKTLTLAKKNDLIVFGGSLYLIGEVRTIERNL